MLLTTVRRSRSLGEREMLRICVTKQLAPGRRIHPTI
jgi:hypothetical protein